LRLPRGTLHRVARRLAPGSADALGEAVALVTDEGRHALEGVARAVPAATRDEPFALPDDTQQEFDALVLRCRHRDRLQAALPAVYGAGGGVRALFKGPSGTGKTLAARQLAAALRRPLYRVDLAATVSKYIGETERNLERVFEAAESLDIVLLLDEGDALLAGRTGVSNATDRYANLETNYLLQRLEHYSGVLVVTTNAAERIDTAFARRVDVSIDFPLPDAATRLALWEAHLGPQHELPFEWLQRVALRCALAGGQIRNAALHALLLAIDAGGTVAAPHLQAALEREYRKAGQRCPSLEESD
ncbi:MAG: ATP-binding protein, partial [Betaproteobacteria bacterium]